MVFGNVGIEKSKFTPPSEQNFQAAPKQADQYGSFHNSNHKSRQTFHEPHLPNFEAEPARDQIVFSNCGSKFRCHQTFSALNHSFRLPNSQNQDRRNWAAKITRPNRDGAHHRENFGTPNNHQQIERQGETLSVPRQDHRKKNFKKTAETTKSKQRRHRQRDQSRADAELNKELNKHHPYSFR